MSSRAGELPRNFCPIPAPWKSSQGWQPPILSWECWGDGMKLGENDNCGVFFLRNGDICPESEGQLCICVWLGRWGADRSFSRSVISAVPQGKEGNSGISGIFGSPMCVKQRDHPVGGAGLNQERWQLCPNLLNVTFQRFWVPPRYHLQLHHCH